MLLKENIKHIKQNKPKIAIIGAGISGLSAAYYLKEDAELTLFESASRLGGHSRTISIEHHAGEHITVDTGFIVLNEQNYPNLLHLFKELNIDCQKTEMSFAISIDEGRLEWSANAFFAQTRNLFDINMYRGLIDIHQFNRKSLAMVTAYPDLTLSQLIEKMCLGSWFEQNYLLPMASSIWSCSVNQIMQSPAVMIVQFFKNHGLLNLFNHQQWYTLVNKSQAYVEAIQQQLLAANTRIITEAKITHIQRRADAVTLFHTQEEQFDAVIFACHPVEILQMVQDASVQEQRILSKFSRQQNIAYTHSDTRLMPKLSKCWSSWNYLCSDDTAISLTYWMNKLQHIPATLPLFVTLNPKLLISEQHLYDQHTFYHPIFDQNAISAQTELLELQGIDKYWYCGAYLRYGFHEDGIWSALNAVNSIKNRIINGQSLASTASAS